MDKQRQIHREQPGAPDLAIQVWENEGGRVRDGPAPAMNTRRVHRRRLMQSRRQPVLVHQR